MSSNSHAIARRFIGSIPTGALRLRGAAAGVIGNRLKGH
jgi:hypothetical protein